MARWLEDARPPAARTHDQAKLRPVVEDASADVERRDDGEGVVAEDRDERRRFADGIASEHVLVMTEGDDGFLAHLTISGSLFSGARTNVAYGDDAPRREA